MAGTPEYTAFQGASQRCSNQRGEKYPQYGGRGVQFLYKSFEEFLNDVGLRPTPKHSLDRKDNNGHYESGNCRWATKSEQGKNRRKHLAVQNFPTEDLTAELRRRGATVDGRRSV